MLTCSHNVPIEHACASCVEEGLERSAKHKPKSIKAKRCKVCKEPFIPRRPMQSCCSYPMPCEATKADQLAAKSAAKRDAAQRKDTKDKLQKFVKISDLEQTARKALQEFRRWQDIKAGYGCISCGKPWDGYDNRAAGHGWDGGHLRSVGSAKHMSLVPENIHLQCVYCNQTLKGNALEYRKGLIARYGTEYVEKLECDNESRKHARQDLIELAAHYRAKTRELLK